MKITTENCKNFINAKEIILGQDVEIGDGTYISAIGGKAERVVIGDNVFIDKSCIVLVPEFQIGDFGNIFKYTRITGYKPCTIGHNIYCDSNVILNSADNLTIGNNVGISSFCAFWTHMKHGDVLEGCRFHYTKEMNIGDDTFFGASCILSPINAGNKSMALAGSVVTKDMEENHIYGGVPAMDITHKLGPHFVERTIKEKVNIMEQNLDEFSALMPGAREQIKIVTSFEDQMDDEISYFNVATRKYTKRRSPIEIKFITSILQKAKFTPCIN